MSKLFTSTKRILAWLCVPILSIIYFEFAIYLLNQKNSFLNLLGFVMLFATVIILGEIVYGQYVRYNLNRNSNTSNQSK